MKKTSILSVDLPWFSKESYTAATWYLLDEKGSLIDFDKHVFNKKDVEIELREKFKLKAPLDFILLDIPMGGNDYQGCPKPKFRGVELALTNFDSFQTPKEKNLCFPTFMAGAKEGVLPKGQALAEKLLQILGHDQTKVIEVFPQTAIPKIVKNYSEDMSFISKLAPHKRQKKEQGHVLLKNVLEKILQKKAQGITINLDDGKGQGIPDLCDSVMGALPLLDFFAKDPFLSKGSVWLVYNPGDVIHPRDDQNTEDKRTSQLRWIEPVLDFPPGIGRKGILCYDYDWLQEKAKTSKLE